MSELNTYHIPTRSGNSCLCYLKSDADKFISDLEERHKMEVGQLLMEIAGLQREDGIPHGSACEGRKQSEAGIQLRTGNPERRMGIMKCDELKPIRQGSVELGEYWVYDAEEVDAAIAELKAALKESEDARYEAGADAADYYQENRKLKRALYKACANWADLEVFDRTVGIDDPNVEANRWALMRNRCLKKAEEYK